LDELVGNVSQILRLVQADLVGGFVVGGGAAGFAVHQAVLTDANVKLRLTEAAKFIALALSLRHFALGATAFGAAGSGGHTSNVAINGDTGNMPLVTEDYAFAPPC
jgi:hypothetical protein